ncbi:hypothetical protein, partial [Listeria fleischmannii]|uniref:hypothetical protein n=1 Tax=Listeria fleischmannii TaxID=1069827 RepID=UPI001CB766C5
NSKITQNKTLLTKIRLLINGEILGSASVPERSVLEYMSTGTEALTTKIAVCQQSESAIFALFYVLSSEKKS